jgi:hypothetical protein
MQQHTGNHRMHTLRQSSCPHPYYTMPVAVIPGELLNKVRSLQHLAHLDGVCFTRIERQVCEDLFRIRISTDPSRLDDKECSHLLFVSSVELSTMTEIFQISAAIIPDVLLNEDSALGQIALQVEACFALIERQIDWDLYTIRIAADPRFLDDEERSHHIHVSLAELLLHARASRTQQKRIEPPPLTNSSASVRRKDDEFKAMQAITISEEEIKKAEGTMDPLEGTLLIHKHRSGSKFLRRLRQWIDLVLFRAVLVALEYQKDLQEAVRHALVTRRRSGKRLINIHDMYEIDGHTYWSVQVFVPIS